MKRRHSIALLLLVACGTQGDDPRHRAASDVELCTQRLRRAYAALRAYDERVGHMPERDGALALDELVTSGDWADAARELACPGAGGDQRPGAGFAARDLARHPLANFPNSGSEPLVACDDPRGANHAGVVNALFADGSIVVYELAAEVERGVLPAGATTIPVGAGSPFPALAQLRAGAQAE
jgi:prepilin-type processing-associated H-X9-DG protein